MFHLSIFRQILQITAFMRGCVYLPAKEEKAAKHLRTTDGLVDVRPFIPIFQLALQKIGFHLGRLRIQFTEAGITEWTQFPLQVNFQCD
jgi:hypothetical protein